MPNFVDIHSHLNFPEYDADRDAVLSRMKDAGVWTITVGTNLETSKSAVALAEKATADGVGVFACIGLHPADDVSAAWNEEAAREFETLARHPRVVAIGECGLDYFRIGTTSDGGALNNEEIAAAKKRQRDIFEAQIALAIAVDKPLMIHCREAYDDVYEILAAKKRELADVDGGAQAADKLRGNMHFYAGDLATAAKFLDIGFTISFTGVITFARNYDEAIRAIPSDSIMSETDAPFVAPAPYRGQRNEPTHVQEVVKKIAEIRGVAEEEMRQTLVQNAVRTFKLAL